MDISCQLCKGVIAMYARYVAEIPGCGMVHPNVLQTAILIRINIPVSLLAWGGASAFLKYGIMISACSAKMMYDS